MSDADENTYNPDVLECIANLSNDEVFTPPEVANAMLDLLPQELFENPDTKFLDPACKSGVFLREIAKRLLKGLEKEYPDLQERVDHIFKEQLYGIAITELTSLLSRRSVYCCKYADSKYSVTKFDNLHGNIFFTEGKHLWVGGKCLHCGIGKASFEEQFADKTEKHAYQFIHNAIPGEIENMKFDVIIGNPPYQMSDGGSGPSASPIYNRFVDCAKRLNPKYITMIIPSRWFAGGKGLDDFRDRMLNDNHISHLIDYPNSADCFAGVDIAGGVNYFLWNREYSGICNICTVRGDKKSYSSRALNQYDIFIRSNESISIIQKVLNSKTALMEDVVFSRNPFGFESKSRGQNKKDSEHSIRLIHSQGEGYVSESDVLKNKESVSKWKVSIGKLVPSNGEVGIDPSKGYNAMTQPRILKPFDVITDSYLVLGTVDTEEKANNFSNYMKLKFPRFLMHETYSSMNISRNNFRFVPWLDFSKPWTDAELYEKYNLTQEEIDFIESMIRPME